MAGRKRVYAGPSMNTRAKRFKPTNRRRRRRRYGKKTNNFTSQSGVGGGIRFKGRMVSRRTWRSKLWNATLQKEHYRSNACVSASINTPASVTTMTVASNQSLSNGVQPFWISTGGAISPDAGNALPLFTGDVVLRGGTIGIRLANTFDTADASRNTLQGICYLIKTTKDWTPGSLPSTVNVGWDPTLIQDFNTTIGRIVYSKKFLLHDADTAQIEYRLKCEKIDVSDYNASFNQYRWIVLAGNVDVSTARSFAYQYYYNLSFSADAIGTT